MPPDGDWYVWLIMAGRGWGKTRTGSEWTVESASRSPNSEWAIISPKFPDTRTVCVEGRSGILPILEERKLLAQYNRSTFELRLTNGAKIFLYGAEDYRMGPRGRNLEGAWCDEVGQWPYEQLWTEALLPALRLGKHPRIVVTTTPRRTPLMLRLLGRTESTVVTRGTTFENEANLSETALLELHREYDNNPIGRQELYGELLPEVKGALWTRETLDRTRVLQAPDLRRIVVGVDPAGTSKESSDETGIVVAGIGLDGHVYVLDDLSCKQSPDGAARVAVEAYHRHRADRIVAETNYGGDYIETVLRHVDQAIAYKTVRATRGKIIRAEPAAALYEQGRVHHVGMYAALEDQLCTFNPNLPEAKAFKSPDRLDALVWAITELVPSVNAGHALYLLREMHEQPAPLPADLPAVTSSLRCGFNACTRPNALPARMGGGRVNLCPTHLAELVKLRLAQVDEQEQSA